MKLITFDALRTLGFADVRYIKPELMQQSIDQLIDAEGILFPEYWQVNSLHYALKKRIFPSPASYHIGHNKIEMTRCFQALAPRHVPWTLIAANSPCEAERIWQTMPLPFVAKIPKSSMGEGVFLIDTLQQWQHYLSLAPVLYVQEYLPIDRDLRIIWVGNKIIAGYWRMQSQQGFYNNVARGGQVEEGIIPKEACDLVETLATGLGIDHGGFDIAMIGHYPYVFEFNRLFGNQGINGLQKKVDEAIQVYIHEQWQDDEPDEPITPDMGPANSRTWDKVS